MGIYSLNKEFDTDTIGSFSDTYCIKDYSEFLNNYVETCKPDFIALVSLDYPQSVIYSKNFNLKFGEDEEETIQTLFKGISPSQVEKILKADQHCVNFIKENSFLAKSLLYILRGTVTLIEGQPRTLLRNVSFVKKNNKEYFDSIFYIAINDVTECVGIKKDPYIDIKELSHKKNKLQAKIAKLKIDINNFFNNEVKLTRREKEILELISRGETSSEIAERLFISVATVNTHRQNLIKKFNVKNTSALIHMV